MMDSQGNMQTASGRLEQIISHFYSKSFHIIVSSRVPSLSTSYRAKKSDKWFHLLLGDPPSALDKLNYWSTNLTDPMIIDIVLVREGTSNSFTKTVLERWIVQYELLAPQTGDNNNTGDCKEAYKKLILLFRSLYSQMRLLPVNGIVRRLSTSIHHTINFDITYQVSSFSDPFSRAEEKMMKEYNFTAVEAFPGRFCLSVTYRTTLSDLNLEFSKPLPRKIIKDYVGSPNVSPLMSFPSRKQGVCDDSFFLRGPRSLPSVAVQHHHNCRSGPSTSFSPSPSPSHSPSPPSFIIDNPMQTQFPSAVVPGSRNLQTFADPSGESLPLSSPRSIKDDSSLQKSSSGNSSSKKIEAHKAGGVASKDLDFSYPFDFDDVDMLGVQPSENVDDKNASKMTSKAPPMFRKSHDAAIGALVHMLSTAPPLHQDISCVPSQSLKTKAEEGVAAASGVSVLQRTDDALEELRSYRKMRDDLLYKCKYEA